MKKHALEHGLEGPARKRMDSPHQFRVRGAGARCKTSRRCRGFVRGWRWEGGVKAGGACKSSIFFSQTKKIMGKVAWAPSTAALSFALEDTATYLKFSGQRHGATRMTRVDARTCPHAGGALLSSH